MSVLKNLMVDVKEAWVSYPMLPGFEVKIAYLARPELVNLRKSCIVTKMDRKTRQGIEVLDEDKFVEKFTKATIKDWKGLTYEHLESLVPVDLAGVNMEEEVPYSADDAQMLVTHSVEFDQWLNEAVFDLQNFRSERD